MKRIAVLQSNYIPWKGYFDIIAAVDEFVLYDCAQYTKNDWRNRNQIKTPRGKSWLTIPVRQRQLGQTIAETEIADTSCFRRHWDAFRQAYARAPHFRDCAQLLEDLFLGPPPSMLSEANERLLRRVCAALGVATPITHADDYRPEGDRNERLLDLCRKAGATHYLSGPAARAYLDEGRFLEAGILVEWMDYRGYPEYPQPYPPFDHAVSILDLLACAGPTAPALLLHAQRKNDVPERQHRRAGLQEWSHPGHPVLTPEGGVVDAGQ